MSHATNPPPPGLSVDFGDELSKNLTIHKNVNQEIIITTADKIRLVLISTKEILASQREWWTPAGLLLSFITTLCTADFKDAWALSKATWEALFVIMTILSIVWLVITLCNLVKFWGQDDVNKIIKEIKLRGAADSSVVPAESNT
jgi:hypothetical protein